MKFYKANPGDILMGPEELPPAKNPDYVYDTLRHSSILGKLFRVNLHGCRKPCLKSQIDMFELFHPCYGRDPRGRHRILKLLPKRRHKWDVDQDEDGEDAWGMNAVFAVAFYKVALYHLLILVGPAIFWGLWLREWPRDWQNAAIPFFAMSVLLSLFWLPFAHNLGAGGKGKRKIE